MFLEDTPVAHGVSKHCTKIIQRYVVSIIKKTQPSDTQIERAFFHFS